MDYHIKGENALAFITFVLIQGWFTLKFFQKALSESSYAKLHQILLPAFIVLLPILYALLLSTGNINISFIIY
jgi:hypothetical protein